MSGGAAIVVLNLMKKRNDDLRKQIEVRKEEDEDETVIDLEKMLYDTCISVEKLICKHLLDPIFKS